MSTEEQYHAIRIKAGQRGWGGPLIIKPQPGKDLIYCVTGGGIHPVAQRIADLSGGTVFDGFKSKRSFNEIAVAVIDCGGTARVGVYPMKGVPTVDVYSTSPSGPLFRFIKPNIFVSGVTVDDVELADDSTVSAPTKPLASQNMAKQSVAKQKAVQKKKKEATKKVVDRAKEAAKEATSHKKKKGFWAKLFFGE